MKATGQTLTAQAQGESELVPCFPGTSADGAGPGQLVLS